MSCNSNTIHTTSNEHPLGINQERDRFRISTTYMHLFVCTQNNYLPKEMKNYKEDRQQQELRTQHTFPDLSFTRTILSNETGSLVQENCYIFFVFLYSTSSSQHFCVIVYIHQSLYIQIMWRVEQMRFVNKTKVGSCKNRPI